MQIEFRHEDPALRRQALKLGPLAVAQRLRRLLARRGQVVLRHQHIGEHHPRVRQEPGVALCGVERDRARGVATRYGHLAVEQRHPRSLGLSKAGVARARLGNEQWQQALLDERARFLDATGLGEH